MTRVKKESKRRITCCGCSISKKWRTFVLTLSVIMAVVLLCSVEFLMSLTMSGNTLSSASVDLFNKARPNLDIFFSNVSSDSSLSYGTSSISSDGTTTTSSSVPNPAETKTLAAALEIVTNLVNLKLLPDRSTSNTTSTTGEKEMAPKRIAIIIAGTIQRFHLRNMLQHLILPLRNQNHAVAVYASFATASTTNDTGSYMDRLHWDRIFTNGVNVLDQDQSLQPSHELIFNIIQQNMVVGGAKIPQLTIKETDNIDADPLFKKQRQQAKEKYPDLEDVDLLFPFFDIRSDEIRNQTITHNRNVLKLMKSIQALWLALRRKEAKLNIPYDYVFFLRDDTMFLQDFDFNALLRNGQKDQNKNEDEVDAFVLSCDVRDPPMHPREINDHGIIIRRPHAHIIGNYYSALFQENLLENCASLLDEWYLDRRRRGCNSGMLFKYILEDQNHLRVQTVSQTLFPFQRSVHLAKKDGKIVPCFHKFCQSRDRPLLNTRGIQDCKNLYP